MVHAKRSSPKEAAPHPAQLQTPSLFPMAESPLPAHFLWQQEKIKTMFEQLVVVDHPNIVKVHKYWLDVKEIKAQVRQEPPPRRLGRAAPSPRDKLPPGYGPRPDPEWGNGLRVTTLGEVSLCRGLRGRGTAFQVEALGFNPGSISHLSWSGSGC